MDLVSSVELNILTTNPFLLSLTTLNYFLNSSSTLAQMDTPNIYIFKPSVIEKRKREQIKIKKNGTGKFIILLVF